MADYNMVCVNCQHGPHIGKECAFGQCQCTNFLRADVHLSRVVTAVSLQLQRMENVIVNIGDLLCMAFPEAFDKLQQEKREAYERQMEASAANDGHSGDRGGDRDEPPANFPREVPARDDDPVPVDPGEGGAAALDTGKEHDQ